MENKSSKQETKYTLNPFFEFYYKKIFSSLLSGEEFEQYMAALSAPLPISFRVNGTLPYCPNIEELFSKQDKELKIQQIEWFPYGLAWKLEIDKKSLRCQDKNNKVFDLVNKMNNSGMITRQEIVSFLPPLILDVKAGDKILDLCAAPGSKTEELLELMKINSIKNQEKQCSGCVIANDIDEKRILILQHQLKRLNDIEGILITNHNALNFPNLLSDNGEGFDKVLADVPCSSDGAIRKNAAIKERWCLNDAIKLHKLQSSILDKSIELTKVGGLILYSTCSQNPIENEAVILEILKKHSAEKIELIDIHNKIPGMINLQLIQQGLKTQYGFASWPVMVQKQKLYKESKKGKKTVFTINQRDNIEEQIHEFKDKKDYIENKDEIKFQQKDVLNENYFPESEEMMKQIYKIQHTMRLLPSDQNTGGFFLALILKKQATSHPLSTSISQTKKFEEQKIEFKTQQLKTTENHPITQKNPEIRYLSLKHWTELKTFFGLDESLQHRLIYHKGNESLVRLISCSVKELFDLNCNFSENQLKISTLGSTAFKKQREKYQTVSMFKLCQYSLLSLLPYISKRKILVSFDLFKTFIGQNTIPIEKLEKTLKQQIEELDVGSLVIYFQEHIFGSSEEIIDAFACFKFKSDLVIMCPKETMLHYNIRYL